MISVEATLEFQRQLRERGSYRTDPDAPRSRTARLLGRFDLYFYYSLLRLLLSGNGYAARGECDTQMWAAHAFAMLRLVEDCGGVLDVSGLHPVIHHNGPTVYVGNHMSMLEGFIAPLLLTHINHFAAVTKQSLLDHPLMGKMSRATGAIGVGRRNPKEDLRNVIEEGCRNLREGRSVLIFPQSTRSAVFKPKEFNSLGVKLARKAGVAVTPIAIKTDFQGNGRFIKDLGRLDRSKTVRLKFGAPMPVEGSGRETHERVVAFITNSLNEWQEK